MGVRLKDVGGIAPKQLTTALFRRAAICLSVSAFCSFPSYAQVEPVETAMGPQVVSFDIRPQDLGSALNAFADRAGLRLLFPSDLVVGRSSSGLVGTFSREQALSRLLAGTGLTYRFTSADTVTIVNPRGQASSNFPVAGAIELDTIEVQGDGDQSPFGPGVGYVATRSTVGSRTDTPIIEAPQSISVVTRQQMDDRKVQNLNEALRYTAGVQAGDTTDLTTESYAIRGYNSPYLSLFRDGTRAMFRAFDSVAEPYGLERVEVLKGPASVLYGQGIPGGIVNLVTKRPTEATLREVQLQGGTFYRRQATFDVSGAMPGNDNILYRLTGLGRISDTQVDYVPDDRVYIAPALTIRSASRDTTLTILSSYQYDHTSFIDGLPARGTVLFNPYGKIPVNRFIGEPSWSKFDRSSFSLGYILDHDVTDAFSVHQTARYTASTYDRNQVQNRGWTSLQDPQEIARRARQGSQTSDRFNIDTHLQYKFELASVKHDVIAGVDYSKAFFKTKMFQGNIAPLNVFNPIYGSPVTTPDKLFNDRETASETGLYVQDQAKLWDRLSIVAGLRQDWADDTYESMLGRGTTTQQNDAALTSRLGIIYDTPIGLAPYASYTQSFTPIAGIDGQMFKPETGEQYEIGLKYQPANTNSFVTLAVFDLVRKNVLTTRDFATYFQTGEIRTRGLELEGVSNLTPEINLVGSYTYNDAKVTQSADLDLGKRPTTVPAHMASFWANYAFKSGSMEGLSIGAGVRYVGNTPGDLTNEFFVPSYTLVDMALRYNYGKFQFSINANNVFDRIYVSTCFSRQSCYYGGRRSVIGTVAYKW